VFDRFSERSRKAVLYAREEARRLNHGVIGPEHLLLGLICEHEGVAAAVLNKVGLDVQIIRQEVEKLVPPGSQKQSLGDIPFSSQAKTSLKLAAEESRGHNYVGTEHMLLGLSKLGKGVAYQVLLNFGLNFDRLRTEVFDFLRSIIPGEIVNEAAIPKILEKQNSVVEELKKRVEELENRVKKLEEK
jgi:ATP-dependent Clp protease ATP-binding subunit ClpC